MPRCIPHSALCLGRTIEGSGLDQAWQAADLYSSITVTQIINGNHHNRAVEAHQVTLQTLFDLWIEAFLEDHHGVHDFLQSSAKELAEACRTKKDVHKAHQTFIRKLESVNLEKQLIQIMTRTNVQMGTNVHETGHDFDAVPTCDTRWRLVPLLGIP